MADYEVLGPGGHARLVSDIKAYVNRADGVGTTQLADESVTMDKLGEDVTDELDGIVHDGDPLNGNVLIGTIAESAVLTTDDAYAAPPKGVSVYGVSTQVGTPTPDAPVEINSVDECVLNIMGKNWLDIHAERKTNTSVAKDGSGVWYPYAVSNYLNNFSGNSLSIDGDTITFTSKANYGFGVEAHVLPGATYTISAQSITVSDGSEYDIRMIYFRKDGTFAYLTLGTNVNRATTTIQSNVIYAIFGISVSANVVSTITVKGLQLELGTTTTAYEPYIGTTIPIPLSNHIARSLPDGTRDTLTLTYQGPSTEHEGWGVFSKTLVQRVTSTVMPENAVINGFTDIGGGFARGYYGPVSVVRPTSNVGLFTHGAYIPSGGVQSNHAYIVGSSAVVVGEGSTADDLKSLYVGSEIVYPLLNPITHDLGEIELPILPNPLTAWADGGSAQPTLAMEYERDVTIVIEQLEAQIEELLTS